MVTIEIIDDRETVLAAGRFGTDRDGYKAMLALARRHPQRTWAVEGCNGIGRHIAQRLVADGETVLDVPAKLSARARVFATGQGRKTDPVDAHSVAVAALRAKGLRQVDIDDVNAALRLLVDRRDILGQTRTELLNRIHKLLLELVPGGAKKYLSADQARAILATIRPRDPVGRTRRRLASELISELVTVDKKIKAADKELTELVASTGSNLRELHGIGPSGAARLLGDVGNIDRFASRGHFASCREPAHQPGPAHHGRRPAAPRHRRPSLLPTSPRRRQDPDGSHARPQTTPVRRRLPADGPRRGTRRSGWSGRTTGCDSAIQRG